MVDSYYGKDDASSFTGYTPVPDSLLCDREFFLEAGIIEHMAQSVAVSAGIEYKSRGEAVPLGFIGAVSKLNLYFQVPVGKKLFTTITETGKFDGVTLVSARVMCEDRLVAEGELKVFILGNPE
jgi:predicted hotdog family 3-hydroxylacyl-ACP dehydratase